LVAEHEGAPAVARAVAVDDLDPATPVTVAVPDDITALRRGDPATASLWRSAVRDALEPLLERGWTITGFDRGHGYRVEAPTSTAHTEVPGPRRRP
jgi:predicted GNAT superfamily acetyltransferase